MEKSSENEPSDIPVGQGFFDRPIIKKLLWILLWACCALSVIAEKFVHRHHHFAQENFFGFYAVLGFAACISCILVAKFLGKFLKTDVDYYDD